jgi:hypothetical protein
MALRVVPGGMYTAGTALTPVPLPMCIFGDEHALHTSIANYTSLTHVPSDTPVVQVVGMPQLVHVCHQLHPVLASHPDTAGHRCRSSRKMC